MDDKPQPIWRRVVRWGALALGTLVWGSGVAAMYGDDYKLAGILYFVGIAIVTIDFITLEDHVEYRGVKKLVMVGGTTIAAALVFAFSVAWIQLRKQDVRLAQPKSTGTIQGSGSILKKETPSADKSAESPPNYSSEPPTISRPHPNRRADWHDKQNWRRFLHTGMTRTEVRGLFGDPEHVSVTSDAEMWSYGAGEITFFTDVKPDGSLHSWSEP